MIQSTFMGAKHFVGNFYIRLHTSTIDSKSDPDLRLRLMTSCTAAATALYCLTADRVVR